MLTTPVKGTCKEADADRDAERLDQNYIDEICIDYVQAGESGEEEYDHDDCESIPRGVTITVTDSFAK